MQAFILAGGFATRLWPLTEKRAKPLLPIAGKPLISYIVDAIPRDIPITVSTNGVFAEDFKRWQKTVDRSLTVSIEDAGHEDQKLGALGAVARWIREETIDDDILLLAGDNYANCDLAAFLRHFAGQPLVAGHDIGNKDLARRFGTIVLENPPSPFGEGAGPAHRSLGEGGGEGGNTCRVVSFEEKPQEPKSTIVSTGFTVLPRGTLSMLMDYAAEHPDNIGGIFEEFLRRNIPVDCFIFTGLWKDIGSFEAYLSLHREIVGQKTLTHGSAKVDAASHCLGSIDLGPATVIEKSTLTDCIIVGNTTIKDCVLERCIVDIDCDLEGIDLTDKMLRAGTVLKRVER